MNLFYDIILQLAIIFIGFALGRFGDLIFGHMKSTHHWTYGVVLIIIGIIFFEKFWGLWLISLGIGMVISDLDDFLHFRVYGVDEPHKWKFWSIK